MSKRIPLPSSRGHAAARAAGLLLVGASMVLCGCAAQHPAPAGPRPLRLAGIFSDNMVLQRDRPLPVWGWGTPGDRLSVTCAGSSVEATVNREGKWRVSLPAMPASTAPRTLSVASQGSTDRLDIGNILVGDVWLCGGQSNMGWPLRRAQGGAAAVAAATNAHLRLLHIRLRVSDTPLDDVQDEAWAECSPVTAAGFSAVGYFFGREVEAAIGVPIGLISCNVGGTPAEAWTRRDVLERTPGLAAILAEHDQRVSDYPRLRSRYEETAPAAIAAYRKAFKAWFAGVDDADRGLAQSWFRPELEDDAWQTVELPTRWHGAKGGVFPTVVWFRRTVDIPEAWNGKRLTLSLGGIDDVDITWFNGTEVGRTGMETKKHWSVPRRYAVPGELVRPGKVVVSIRVRDFGTAAGFIGKPADMFLAPADADGEGGRLSLAGPWRQCVGYGTPVADMPAKPRPPPNPVSPHAPAALYNAMLHPLIPFALTGVIWYQGESNGSRPVQYRDLFPALIRNWRSDWERSDLPFIWVQLAGFEGTPSDLKNRNWPELREAQSMALALPNTAQAVAIDVGDADDIHPRDKKTVGHRLALAARKIVYGEDLVYSGPMCTGARRAGDKVRLTFDHVGGGLTARGDKLTWFEIAGPDAVFVPAQARIVDNEVVVSAPGVETPAWVRYAWANNPEGCNLYNAEGLPASPFRVEVE